MKQFAKIFLLFFGATVFLFSVLFAHDKTSVEKVYEYLGTKWRYYDVNGKKIDVRKLSWKSLGNDYTLMVNGRSLDPTTVYDKSGKNILNPTRRNKAKPVVVKGNEKGIMRGMTEAHNKYRRKTGGGLPDLVWDENIAAYAQQWANHLKQTRRCNMQHRSGRYRVKQYGENLAWSSGRELEAADVVAMWYSEIKDYNYNNNSCSGVCGHYTQVVWRNSKKVGCGMARCGNSEVWVCSYDPPGNWVGEKPY